MCIIYAPPFYIAQVLYIGMMCEIYNLLPLLYYDISVFFLFCLFFLLFVLIARPSGGQR